MRGRLPPAGGGSCLSQRGTHSSGQDMQIDPRRCAMIIQDLQNDVIMDGGAFASSARPRMQGSNG